MDISPSHTTDGSTSPLSYLAHSFPVYRVETRVVVFPVHPYRQRRNDVGRFRSPPERRRQFVRETRDSVTEVKMGGKDSEGKFFSVRK